MNDFKELMGKTLRSVYVDYAGKNKDLDNDTITFVLDTGEIYRMTHQQDCCEMVFLEEIIGDIIDLVGSPIVDARVEVNEDPHLNETWTFYIISSLRGSVTLRWYGTSNGYYSEAVDFERIQ